MTFAVIFYFVIDLNQFNLVNRLQPVFRLIFLILFTPFNFSKELNQLLGCSSKLVYGSISFIFRSFSLFSSILLDFCPNFLFDRNRLVATLVNFNLVNRLQPVSGSIFMFFFYFAQFFDEFEPV